MNWQQLKSRLKNEARKFAHGRAGADQLTVSLLFFSLILTFLASVLRAPWLQLFYYGGVLIAIYRMLSRDVGKRRRENQLFLQRVRSLTTWLRIQKRIWQERKTHKHFRCTKCKQRLRVPKGRGNINVTCSKCGNQFQIKS